MKAKIKTLTTKGGLHGGMMFAPSVTVFILSPTKSHPRRYKKLFRKPSLDECIKSLDKIFEEWAYQGEI